MDWFIFYINCFRVLKIHFDFNAWGGGWVVSAREGRAQGDACVEKLFPGGLQPAWEELFFSGSYVSSPVCKYNKAGAASPGLFFVKIVLWLDLRLAISFGNV